MKVFGIALLVIALIIGAISTLLSISLLQEIAENPFLLSMGGIEMWQVYFGLITSIGTIAICLVSIIFAAFDKLNVAYTIAFALPVAGLISIFAIGSFVLIISGVLAFLACLLLKKQESELLLESLNEETELALKETANSEI